MIRLCCCILRDGIVNSANPLFQSVRHRHVITRNPFKRVKPLAVALHEPDRNLELKNDSYDFDDAEGDPEEPLEHPEHYYDQYMDELRLERRKVRNAIIRRKYFKVPPETNLLTWAAKQQIHYLHSLDPEEWTAEKISESFPISVQGVKKLLKSRFTVATPERIAEHDREVQLKWKSLKTGKGDEKISPITKELYLDGKLQEDQSYVNKALPVPPEDSHSKALQLSDLAPKPGQYSKLIATYMKLKNPEKKLLSKKHVQSENEQEYDDAYIEDVASATTLRKLSSRGAHVRFEDYKAAAVGKSKLGASEYANSREQIPHSAAVPGNEDKTATPVNSAQQHTETFEILEATDGNSAMFHQDGSAITDGQGVDREVLKRRIKIPSHLKDRGSSLHRVGKCYYDNDGEILYKVP
uniref:Uncharacterized protein n=1 Tax=Amblyomma triste TaxID=251400 RepID=A0A023G8R6_AMBTT